ncbi:MAG: hypothetical protein ABFS09_05290 [Thermodesulfobacteriota bacterium]
MKNLIKQTKRCSWQLAILGVMFGVLLVGKSSFAQVPAPQPVNTDGSKEELEITEEAYSENVKELMHYLEGRASDFVYLREGRPDPFMPFIKDKVVQEVDVEVEDYGVLTGMQKFEPGQLSVVAIVQKQQGPIAMVQDSTGKGYLLSAGEKLGRNGVVEEITGNMILVKQQYKMTSGAIRHRVVKMLLKREGE